MRYPLATVGAWTFKGNPKADYSDVWALADRNPLRALSHPNCPEDLWWQIAEDFPLEAPKTPAGQLILLENPGRWAALEHNNAYEWMRRYEERLSPGDKRLFAADCAERALSLFEDVHPHEKAPRYAIKIARAFVRGEADETQLHSAKLSAEEAYSDAQREGDNDLPEYGQDLEATLAACHAASDVNTYEQNVKAYDYRTGEYTGTPAGEAAEAAAKAIASAQCEGAESYVECNLNERLWQWKRMAEYLRGEVVGGITSSRLTREVVKTALRQTGFNQKQAAALLGVSPPTISKLVKQYGISHEEAGLPSDPHERASELYRRRMAAMSEEERSAFRERKSEAASAEWAAFSPEKQAAVKQGRAEQASRNWQRMPHLERATIRKNMSEAARERWAKKKQEEVGRSAGYKLQDVTVRARKYPKTFQIPSLQKRMSLQPGHLVKLIFLPATADTHKASGERMWVVVTGRTKEGYQSVIRYDGVLDNDPVLIHGLKAGAVIHFKPQHIADIHKAKLSKAKLATYQAKVGARKPSVRNDPMAPREQILKLAKQSQRDALWHPNCPLDLWWQYAALYPVEAPLTPLGFLVLLESPNEWAEFEQRHADDWVRHQPARLSPRGRRFFGIAEAERVLHFWEEAYPADSRPRGAIEKAKQYQAGLGSEEELIRASKAAGKAGDEHKKAYHKWSNTDGWPQPPGDVMAPSYAAWAAHHAAGPEPARAAYFAEWVREQQPSDSMVPTWRRLREYLLAEMPQPEQIGALWGEPEGRNVTDPLLAQLIEQTRELFRLTEEAEQMISSRDLPPYYNRREAVPDIETLYLSSHWRRFWELLGQLFAAVHPRDDRYQEVATFYAKLFAMMGERLEYVRSKTWYDRIYDAGNRYLEHLLGIGTALDALVRREYTEEDLVLDFDPTAVNGSAGHHLRLLLQLFDSYGIAAGLTPTMMRFLSGEHRERGMSRKRR